MLKNDKALMRLFAFITVFLWALGYVLTRFAVRHFNTEAVSFLRYFIAAIALIIFAFVKKLRLPALNDIPLFFVGGAVGFAVYVYLINEGSRMLTASVVSFIISATPVITALLARLYLKEKIGLLGWFAIICAFLGVGIITYFNGGFTANSGVVWIFTAAVLISVYNIFQRKLLIRYTPLEITTYCVVCGALLLSVFAPQSFPQLKTASTEQIVAIIVLGVFSAGIAYLCWAYALSKAENTSEVSNFMFITPLLTTILGFVLIGEVPHISVYIGGALILAGVIFIKPMK